MKTTTTLVLLLCAALLGAQESHTVQANQTLYSIARLYNVSVDQLRSWNNLTSESIRVGQSLVVKPAAQSAANPGLNPFLYTVRTGDSLSALAVKFDTPVETLRRINALAPGQGLYVGQRLYIRRPVGVTFYTVQAGDTLSQVSALFDIAAQDLRSINQLSGDSLAVGRVLRVFKPAEVPLNHTVASTDSPEGVAALYGLSVDELKKLNGAEALNLKVGQVLRLRSYSSAAQGVFTPPADEKKLARQADPVTFPDAAPTYVVQRGDTLLKITRSFGLRLDQLLAWNRMNADDVLHVGQTLVLGPGSAPVADPSAAAPTPAPVAVALTSGVTSAPRIAFPEEPKAPTPLTPAPVLSVTRSEANLPAFRDEDQAKIRWDSYVVLDKDIPVFEWNSDYYYWTHPGELSQPNRGYYENNWPSPLDAYKKATQLLGQFDRLIEKQGSLSNLLKGRTIVLDPGHGGIDPGAIVKATDEAGKDIYLTEHEYVYDISLRVYALLKRHGADVRLTVLAPSHLIRDTKQPGKTLVNEKNQVYNDLALNQKDDPDAWPNGSQAGLDKRVAIAAKAFRGVSAGNRVFVSLHADSNPSSPLGSGVYALRTAEGTDQKSLAFAEKLVPYLGADAYARTQNLAVLRGNDADYKVLVEVHNLASDEQSQAMRAGSSRQLSAQKIVRGILEALGR